MGVPDVTIEMRDRCFLVSTSATVRLSILYPRPENKPITRANRKKAQQLAGTDEALDISTQMLCEMAELEDGTKPFASADAAKLQRRLPESVLNDLELFLFGLAETADLDEAKND